MIIGYQITNQDGWNWHDNLPSSNNPRTVLTESTALIEIKRAQLKFPDQNYKMVAVLKGDVKDPIFENELSNTTDQFKTIGINTQHLTEDQLFMLYELASSEDEEHNNIFSRNGGVFIKLFEHHEDNNYGDLGESFYRILKSAHEAGFLMIEFDVDAEIQSTFPTF